MTVDLSELEQHFGLPPGLLAAVQQTESGGDPNAVSPKGALGAYQFMPATAAQYGIDPLNPDQAAQGAAHMYSDLLKKYNGDLPSALAAYNEGQGNLDHNGLQNAPPETQGYINKVITAMNGVPDQSSRPSPQSDQNPTVLPWAPPGREPPRQNASLMNKIGNFIIPSAEASEMPSGPSVDDIDTELARRGITPPASPQDQVASDVRNEDQSNGDPSGLGAQPWSALHVESQGLPDVKSKSSGPSLDEIDAELAKRGILPSGPSAYVGEVGKAFDEGKKLADQGAFPLHLLADYLNGGKISPETAKSAPTSTLGSLGPVSSALGLYGMATSPVEGAVNAFAANPVQNVTGIPAGATNMALNLLLPYGAIKGLSALSEFLPAADTAAESALAKIGQPDSMASPLETDVSKISPDTPIKQYENLKPIPETSPNVSADAVIADQVKNLQDINYEITRIKSVGTPDPAGRARLAQLENDAAGLRDQLGMKEQPANPATSPETVPLSPAQKTSAATQPNGPSVNPWTGKPLGLSRAIVDNSDEAKAVANRFYKEADQKGGIVNDPTKIINSMAGKDPITPTEIAVAKTDPVRKFLNDFSDVKNSPLSLSDAQILDEELSNRIGKEYGISGLSKDGYKLLDAQTKFRESLASTPPESVGGGAEGYQAWKNGQKAWQQARKLEDLEKIQQAAELSDNPSTIIKTRLRTLLTNKSRMRGYSAEEIQALTQAADRGVIGGAMHVFGSRLIPMGASLVGEAVGGIPGAVLGGVIGHGGSSLMRAGATAIQSGKLKNAATVLGRSIPK